MIAETKSIEENLDYNKLSSIGGNKKVYGLDSFKTLEKLIKDIHTKNIKIDEAEMKENKFSENLDEQRDYPARGSKYKDLQESFSKNVKKKENMTNVKKRFMDLKMEYYHLLKRMVIKSHIF